ncbi:hypothetical protein D030_3535A, partial [Vibrio parahaemolyticus AQ3810]
MLKMPTYASAIAAVEAGKS